MYLRQMDTASGPLCLAYHLFHLAGKTSTEDGLISCNVIGYNSEPVGAEFGDTKPPSIDQEKQHWETFSGRKKLLHIYLYFHILFTYLFVIIIIRRIIIICIRSREEMETGWIKGMLKECHFLLLFFLKPI